MIGKYFKLVFEGEWLEVTGFPAPLNLENTAKD